MNRRISLIALFSLLVGLAHTFAADVPAMPDTTPPGKPHFDKLGAQVGQQLPAVRVYHLDGSESSLDYAWGGTTTLLLTSSYTCPKSRSTYPIAAAFAAKFKDKVAVAIIYIIEAHPSGDSSPYSGHEEVTNENRRDGVLCRQPKTLQERLSLAHKFKKQLNVETPVFVDAMENSAWNVLGGGPNMGVLVDKNGFILARQGWFDEPSMEKAATEIVKAIPPPIQPKDAPQFFQLFDEIRPTLDGDLAKVKAQIDLQPDIVKKVYPDDLRGNDGDRTLLHYAVGTRSDDAKRREIVKLLIEKGADVNKQTQRVPTPLHLAAANGDVAICRYLIDHGAQVNARAQGRGPTPLQEALIHRHREVADMLMAAGAKPNFFTDIATGNVAAVAAKVEADKATALVADGWGRPPLVYAAGAGQLKMARLLMSHGAVDLPRPAWGLEVNRNALWWAVAEKDLPLVRLLCDTGSDPNLPFQSIYAGSVDVLRELIAHKADVNACDITGHRPLHYAALFDRPEMAACLLDAGADPNAATGPNRAPCPPPFNDMVTPMHFAAQTGAADILVQFLKHAGHVDVKKADGETPLHAAANSYEAPSKVLPAIRVLLDAKADMNAKDNQGRTPLDYAIKHSTSGDKPDTSVVDLLRKQMHERSPDAATNSPRTPQSP